MLAHELVHAQVGIKAGHKAPFQKVAKTLGFVAPFTDSSNHDIDARSWFQSTSAQCGPYPHKSLNGLPEKKQTTRLIKAECQECGYCHSGLH